MSGTASLRVSLTYTILPANTVEALSPCDHSRKRPALVNYDHLASVAGVRKGRGRELGRETTRAQIPPSPSPFNACHAG